MQHDNIHIQSACIIDLMMFEEETMKKSGCQKNYGFEVLHKRRLKLKLTEAQTVLLVNRVALV